MMIQNTQNLDAVFQQNAVDAGHPGAITTGATLNSAIAFGGASRVDSALVLQPVHAYLGRRLSDPRPRGKQSPCMSGVTSEAGIRGSHTIADGERRLRRDEATAIWPASSRVMVDPPAAGWAMLVLNRALGA